MITGRDRKMKYFQKIFNFQEEQIIFNRFQRKNYIILQLQNNDLFSCIAQVNWY